MKTYEVLCMTCGGTGSILNPMATGPSSTTPITDICPVCNGGKTQWVIETDDSFIPVALQNGSITLSDAVRLMQ